MLGHLQCKLSKIERSKEEYNKPHDLQVDSVSRDRHFWSNIDMLNLDSRSIPNNKQISYIWIRDKTRNNRWRKVHFIKYQQVEKSTFYKVSPFTHNPSFQQGRPRETVGKNCKRFLKTNLTRINNNKKKESKRNQRQTRFLGDIDEDIRSMITPFRSRISIHTIIEGKICFRQTRR